MIFEQNKIKYLRIIVTNRCNLNCYYCHKEGIIETAVNELKPQEVIYLSKLAYDIGIRKFKLLGGEPLLRKDLPDIVKGLRQLSEDIDISIITNGILARNVIDDYAEVGVNRFNVSLHGWRGSRFEKITGVSSSKLEKTKESILYLKARNLLTKVNYLFLKGENEAELLELIQWISLNDIKLDILNVLYNSASEEKLKGLHYSFEEILEFLKRNCEIEAIRSSENMYSLPSTTVYLKQGGRLNLKNTPLNKERVFKACENCQEFKYCSEGIKAIRLTKDGKIKPCIFRDDNIFDIFSYSKDNSYENTLEKFNNYIEQL